MGYIRVCYVYGVLSIAPSNPERWIVNMNIHKKIHFMIWNESLEQERVNGQAGKRATEWAMGRMDVVIFVCASIVRNIAFFPFFYIYKIQKQQQQQQLRQVERKKMKKKDRNTFAALYQSTGDASSVHMCLYKRNEHCALHCIVYTMTAIPNPPAIHIDVCVCSLLVYMCLLNERQSFYLLVVACECTFLIYFDLIWFFLVKFYIYFILCFILYSAPVNNVSTKWATTS